MQTFLHVGCGPKRKQQTSRGFNSPEWREIRLDIDPNAAPDVVASMLDMQGVPDASVDAVFSSHNIEHLYPHEVPRAVKEFNRVLKPDGFLIITCPDLQEICRLVADDRLTEPAYQSPAGPIAPIDVLYGYRRSMQAGNLFMAHKCGFTLKVLVGILQAHGFASAGGYRRLHPFYDLWAAATKAKVADSRLQALLTEHQPI